MSPTESSLFTFAAISSAEANVALTRWASHPNANYCHHAGWPRVFHEAYGKTCQFYSVREIKTGRELGISGLVFMNSPWSGKVAFSLPYLDYGSLIAEHAEAEKALIIGLICETKAKGYALEIRSERPFISYTMPENAKVRMVLSLSDTNQVTYWKALDAKVRNQVRKAEKSGVLLKTGGAGLLDDFYRVFCINMRDLGSPVHARRFFQSALNHIEGAEIVNAYRENRCIGGLFRIRFGNTLAIPWASTLREERIYSPNNALYYNSISHAFDLGLNQLDFGRSTREEGTYKFKKQWLATEYPLYWYPFDPTGELQTSVSHLANSKMEMATRIWSKLPILVANTLGSRLRPYIPA